MPNVEGKLVAFRLMTNFVRLLEFRPPIRRIGPSIGPNQCRPQFPGFGYHPLGAYLRHVQFDVRSWPFEDFQPMSQKREMDFARQNQTIQKREIGQNITLEGSPMSVPFSAPMNSNRSFHQFEFCRIQLDGLEAMPKNNLREK
jgi:hypothetical protein